MENNKKKLTYSKKASYGVPGALLFLMSSTACFADIVLHGNQIISSPVSYHHQTLDLTDGRFTVKSGGTLDIEDSTIITTISSANPYLIHLHNGQITLKNNTVNVKVNSIAQNFHVRSPYQLIRVKAGTVDITGNDFSVSTPFSVGLLETLGTVTHGFTITNNTINNFHGGLHLFNSYNAKVDDNIFSNVSFSNIFNRGDFNSYNRNIFSFPGNLMFGDAIDIVNSDSVTVSSNIISSGSNYGISITGGQDLFIDNNKITDGASYAILIQTPTLAEVRKNESLSSLLPLAQLKFDAVNNNIVIKNNYLSQNKYGLTGGLVNQLIVMNNIFIQRFSDTSIRQYWTNNDNLLPSVTNLTWLNNEYKEAFTQDNAGDNTSSLQFANFPAHGGVSLP